MPILKADHYSSMKKSVQYGKAGEKVKLITDGIEVVVVENGKGERYSIRREKLIIN